MSVCRCREENQQTQPIMTPSLIIEPGPHCWEASVLTTNRPLHPEGGRYSIERWEYLHHQHCFWCFSCFYKPFIWSNRLKRPNNSNNNSELYNCYNTALQTRGKHIYSNINTRVQRANFDIFATLICMITFIQYSKKGQMDLSLVSKHDVMNKIDRRLT